MSVRGYTRITAVPPFSPNATNERSEDTGAIDLGIGCRVIDSVRIEFNGGYRFKTDYTSDDPLDADVESFTGMVNAWWDVYGVGGWKPYVGGGIGFAVHDINSRAPFGSHGSATDATFAWQLGAGVGIDVTDHLTLDIGYRFTDLGRPEGPGATRSNIDDFQSHEFRVGLRYDFDGIF